jgi:dsRNA-specific ribonuclease
MVMDNYKNTLQEMCQKNGSGLPKYTLESDGGLPNSPMFEVSVTVEWNGQIYVERATAVGKKRKEVEKMAAKKMVERLRSGIIIVCCKKHAPQLLT